MSVVDDWKTRVAKYSVQAEESNAEILFHMFTTEHCYLLKSILVFVRRIQNLSFSLDAVADLSAQRYFGAQVFGESLNEVFRDDPSPVVESMTNEMASSAILWALHSKSQR